MSILQIFCKVTFAAKRHHKHCTTFEAKRVAVLAEKK